MVAVAAGAIFIGSCRPNNEATPPITNTVIVVSTPWWQDAALSLAVDELTAAMTSSGVSTSVVQDKDIAQLPAYALVVGTETDPWVKILLGEKGIPKLKEEGYIIERRSYQGAPAILIAGKDVLGATYGMFHLAERLRLDNNVLTRPLRIRNEPKMTLRLISDPNDPSYPTPEQALRWGFNAVAVEPWPSLALYDGIEPALYDPETHAAERAWVEENRHRARERLAAAKRLHLKVVSSGDVLTFPQQVLDLYPDQVTDGNPNRFSLDKAKTRQLLSYALDEVLQDFPDIDAIMVRSGENYAQAPLEGNTLQEGGCEDEDYVSCLQTMVALVQSQVASHGKVYIQRAWDLGEGGFHANPQIAKEVLTGINSDGSLILSFKQTETDFWRYNEVNPNLRSNGFPKMVEFQAAREYEGKGAFPNYLGEVFARGGEEKQPRGGMDYAYQQGVRAVWVWAKGGGWEGPYPSSDLWVEANLYALSHLAWEPKADPHALAQNWATLRFGPTAAPYVGQMLMTSAEAVRKAFYIEPYARKRGGWVPNNLWIRDDIIFGGDRIKEIYQVCRNEKDFDAALAEKKEAVTLIQGMIQNLRNAQPLITDQALAEQAMNTLLYEKALLETLQGYFEGMFYYYRWQEIGNQDQHLRQQAINRITQGQKAWERYHSKVALLPGVATPFHDGGMGETMARALDELEGN
ncbi:MAG: hypothetical protein HY664_06065 [Chloroflexi bacterium]|nr:hypothetical protein [Chloroflexota bacterium]